MNMIIRLTFLLIALVDFNFATLNTEDKDAVLIHLSTLGHLKLEKEGTIGKSIDRETALKESILKYQKYHRLNETGRLDEPTKKLMVTPRCGLPDQIGIASIKSKWAKNDLTFAVLNGYQNLNVNSIITRAFSYWSQVCKLNFRPQAGQSGDFKIMFGSRNHGDNYPFDGKSGVLAHAFFPSDGRIHFDSEEQFTENSNQGTNLLMVAIHEIGHSLGLDHSSYPGSIMNPYYTGFKPNFKLGDFDVRSIQNIYGARSQQQTTRTTLRPTTRTTQRPTTRTTPRTTARTTVRTTVRTTPRTTTRPKTVTTTTRKTTKPTTTTRRTTTRTTPRTTQRTTRYYYTTYYTFTYVYHRHHARKSNKKARSLVMVSGLFDRDIEMHIYCKLTRNSFLFKDNNQVYILDESKDLWTFNNQTGKFIRHDEQNIYKHLLRGDVYGVTDNHGVQWIFERTRIWAFKNSRPLKHFPIMAYYPDDFQIQAVVYKDNRIYLIHKGDVYHFDTRNYKTKKVDGLFPEVGNKLGTVTNIVNHNGFYFIFTHQSVFKIDQQTNRLTSTVDKIHC